MHLHRTVRSFMISLVSVASAAAVLPGGAAAQSDTGPLRSVDQVRAAFSGAGYQLDSAYTWDWTMPPVTSFQVHDPVSGRVVMALVYPSSSAADTARVRAASRDGGQLLSGDGPHLVAGFGASVWSGNVALVETTQSQLDRMYQAQQDRDNGIYVDQLVFADPATPTIAVDLDFQQALNGGAVNL